MKNKILLIIILTILISCSKNKEELPPDVFQGRGTVWLSGGLYYCAEQIRMDNGDTLIILNESELIPFKSGERVEVEYTIKETEDSGCEIGIDCEIIDIQLTK